MYVSSIFPVGGVMNRRKEHHNKKYEGKIEQHEYVIVVWKNHLRISVYGRTNTVGGSASQRSSLMFFFVIASS